MAKKATGFIIILILSLVGYKIFCWQQQGLVNSVFRLHVIANSNDPADQILKLAVKDDIVTMMQKEYQNVDDVDEARRLAIQDLPRLQALARARVKASGYDYPVKVTVGEYDFPVKSYGNLVLPQGRYQAVRVVIGEGQGKNWWCVLFPPLCLVSSSSQGMSLDSPQKARVTFKCLELLPRGARLVNK